MNKHLFCIIIAEPDNTFRKKLKAAFNNVESTLPAVKFNFIEPKTAEELHFEMDDKRPDMLFLNAAIMQEGGKKLMTALRNRKRRHQLIMVIGDKENDEMAELSDHLEKGKPVYLSGAIRKSNFSFELMAILIRFFVKRATR